MVGYSAKHGKQARAVSALAAVCAGIAPLSAHGEAPIEPKTAPEAAAAVLLAPVQQRHVVRNADSGFDVWLIGAIDLRQAVANARRAIGTKQLLYAPFRLDRVTFLEHDQSFLLDLAGGERPWRLRLSQHLQGSLIEVQGAGEADDAPRWTPPFRPQPLYLLHGPVLR